MTASDRPFILRNDSFDYRLTYLVYNLFCSKYYLKENWQIALNMKYSYVMYIVWYTFYYINFLRYFLCFKFFSFRENKKKPLKFPNKFTMSKCRHIRYLNTTQNNNIQMKVSIAHLIFRKKRMWKMNYFIACRSVFTFKRKTKQLWQLIIHGVVPSHRGAKWPECVRTKPNATGPASVYQPRWHPPSKHN